MFPVFLCPAADSAFMPCCAFRLNLCHILLKLLLPVDLPGRKSPVFSGEKKKQNKIQQGHKNRCTGNPGTPDQFFQNKDSIDQPHPFHLYGKQEVQQHLHIRISYRKSQEDGHIDIICAKEVGPELKPAS